ncbi:MAG: 30S ribosomal protein S12 methylthiotransferase RimO [Magnetococcales bacterium]|nr:30S ribosomal protein S12 methylthiotransferase RimO [Magnetococcales bacterium]
MRKIGLISLGCPKNLVDSELMLGQFRQAGDQITADPQQADILIVNTCGFIGDAERESRQAIDEMARLKARHPGRKLVVTGCLAQRYGDQLVQQYPEIDLLLGSGQYDRVIPLVAQHETGASCQVERDDPGYLPVGATSGRLLTTPAHLAYVKIAEGCNNPCSFCIIPQLRGPFRSRSVDDIVAEVQQLSAGGVREIMLVSQDTTLYGRDLTPRTDLATLLEQLASRTEVCWIRLLYLYPTLITERLLRTMAALPNVVPYLDMPLQHAHSDTLQRMRRTERSDTIQRLLERIDQHLPQATLRTTLITGFPGESEREFAALEQLIRQERFDHVGVFVYSDEPEAASSALPDKIPPKLAAKRRDRLMTLQQQVSRRKLARWRQQQTTVMIDGRSRQQPQLWIGRTAGQGYEMDGVVLIAHRAQQPLVAGQLAQVTITGSKDYDLTATVATV